MTFESLSLDLGPDVEVCENDSLTIGTDINGSYLWSDGTIEESLTVTTSGSYWLELQTAICVVSDTIEISFVSCDSEEEIPRDSMDVVDPESMDLQNTNCNVYVPNAMTRTPRANPRNIELGVFSNCDIDSQRLLLYDRYGNLLYRGDNTGLQENLPNINPGVYAMKVVYRLEGEVEEREVLELVTIF